MRGFGGLAAATCRLCLLAGLGVVGCKGGAPAKPVVTVEPRPAVAVQPPRTVEVKPARAPEPGVEEVKAPALAPARPGLPHRGVVRKVAAAPAIDGDLSDACWRAAEVPGIWVDVYTGTPAEPQPKAYICYDDTNVYVAFLNPEPNMKGVVAEAVDRDGAVWIEDANEIFIDTTTGREDYYQLIINTKGVVYDAQRSDGTWNSSVRVAVKKMDDAWSLEVAIPLSDLGVTGSPTGQIWRANFCRDRQATGEAQAHVWADTGESYHNPEAFGRLLVK